MDEKNSSKSPFCNESVHVDTLQMMMNEKFFELKKGHIGIVEKAQETSSDSDMHNTVCLCHCSTS